MKSANFTFIDLFAGIGGIRIAFENAGGKCVFSSEFDKFAQLTYHAFFNEYPAFLNIFPVNPPGDITKIPPSLIPDHDILTGGFPCQPFSLAGVSKKNSLGKPHGFNDPTKGTLFFNIKEIIVEKKPKAFLLENVKNLERHDEGKTFQIIKNALSDIGYSVYYRIIDSSFWVPQHRERIYIIGFRNPDKNQTWEVENFDEFYKFTPPTKRLFELDEILEKRINEKYYLKEKTWETLKRHKAHHQSMGNGFGYGLISPPFRGKITRTLSARYHKDGAEILIDTGNTYPRKLTPLECCRLMGFPEQYQSYFNSLLNCQPVSDTQAYKQFGNSVVVPVMQDVAKLLTEKLIKVGAIK
ncbi:MAG: DNA (cytosine-5-)-methyltransferase [Anaerolineaceae bacterium]